MKNFIQGFNYALVGFKWITQPKIRRYVYIPLLINTLLFIIVFVVLRAYLFDWVGEFIGKKTDWWYIFQWAYDIVLPVITVIMYVGILLVTYFSFSSIANLLASPFNASLAKAVEQRLNGTNINFESIPLTQEIRKTISSEISKIVRFICYATLILLLLLIPGINVFFPFIWFLFMAFSLSIQYADYPMANHMIFYKQQRIMMKSHTGERLGFGTAAEIMLMIPIVNFVAMPVCICGATVWWHKSLEKTAESQ